MNGYLFLMNALYLLEWLQLFSCSNIVRTGYFYTSLLFGIIASLKLFPINRTTVSNLNGVLLGVFTALLLLLFFEFILMFPVTLSPHYDELFRLSYAHNIATNGIPPPRGWWIFGDSGYISYYILTEYLAVASGSWVFGQDGISLFYLQAYPILLHGFLLFVIIERIFSIKPPRKWSNNVALFVTIFLTTLIVLWGISPYSQGQHHLSIRQNSLAHLLIALLVTFCTVATASMNRGLSLLLFIVASMLVGMLISVKILYLVVAGLFFLTCLALCWISGKIRLGHLALVGIILAISIAANLSASAIFSAGSSSVKKLIFYPFSLVERLGPYWLSPYCSLWSTALFVSLLLPLVVLIIAEMKRAPTNDIDPTTIKIVVASIVLAAITALFFGLFICFSTDTGGAEAYWLISSWFITGFGFIVLLSSCRSNTTAWNLMHGFVFLWTMFAIATWVNFVRPSLALDYGPIKELCQHIQLLVNTENTDLSKIAIAHPLFEDRKGWAFNGYCGLPTLAVPEKTGPYGRGIKKTELATEAWEDMRWIVAPPTLDTKIRSFLERRPKISQLFVIRESPLKTETLTIAGAAPTCELLCNLDSYYRYNCSIRNNMPRNNQS